MRKYYTKLEVRMVRESIGDRPQAAFDCANKAAALARDLLKDSHVEQVIVICLNARLQVSGVHYVSKGGVTETKCPIQEVFTAAILTGSHSIVMAHNHPSGQCSPSPADVDLTTRVRQAGIILGIELLDHIIVGETKYYTFAEEKEVCYGS